MSRKEIKIVVELALQKSKALKLHYNSSYQFVLLLPRLH
jgi:hypothetical protein